MLLQSMLKSGVIVPPDFLVPNTMYLCVTGSQAYGMATAKSDMDLHGYTIPPKHIVFPHLQGEIKGFGTQCQNFEQYIKHHILFENREYDLTIFSIIKYFQQCMDCNPDKLDTLFVPRNCILHTTVVHEMVRDKRELFLSKLCIPKFKGYAHNQFSKLGRENYEPTGKRYEMVQKYGYDVKNASHVFRLLLQAKQLLKEGTMELDRNADLLLSVRAGEFTLPQVEKFFREGDEELRKLAEQSKLPERPPESAIKKLLLDCLEHHYGNITGLIIHDKYVDFYNQVRALAEKV